MRISDWSSDVCSSDLDSELWNAEARYEWYFDRDQRFTLAAFYKSIDNPIEAYTSISDSSVNTSYANAPKATLYGAAVELQKYVPLADMSEDRKSVVSGKGVSVRVDLGGRRTNKKKKEHK